MLSGNKNNYHTLDIIVPALDINHQVAVAAARLRRKRHLVRFVLLSVVAVLLATFLFVWMMADAKQVEHLEKKIKAYYEYISRDVIIEEEWIQTVEAPKEKIITLPWINTNIFKN